MNLSNTDEIFFSVDIETAGPNPSQYSLLSIGACTINKQPPSSFYVELKPVNDAITPEAYATHRLSMEKLARIGLSPAEALAQFDTWVKSQLSTGEKPVFVAFNAPFDWMFITDYFFRFLGYNPFGHSALDIKALYMGLTGAAWSKTSMKYLGPRYLGDQPLTHHALRDALDQATIFEKIISEIQA